MALVVLDSSVLIAFLDPSDAHHRASVAALAARRHDELVTPATAYAELLVHPQQRGAAAVAHVRRVIDELPVRIEAVGREVAERAAQLRRRVRLADAFVLATGDVLGADVVLTADARWPKASRRAEVV